MTRYLIRDLGPCRLLALNLFSHSRGAVNEPAPSLPGTLVSHNINRGLIHILLPQILGIQQCDHTLSACWMSPTTFIYQTTPLRHEIQSVTAWPQRPSSTVRISCSAATARPSSPNLLMPSREKKKSNS